MIGTAAGPHELKLSSLILARRDHDAPENGEREITAESFQMYHGCTVAGTASWRNQTWRATNPSARRAHVDGQWPFVLFCRIGQNLRILEIVWRLCLSFSRDLEVLEWGFKNNPK